MTMTFKNFAAKYNVIMTSKFVGITQRDKWTAFKFKVTLAHRGKTFTTSYSLGSGHLEVSSPGMFASWKQNHIPGFTLEIDETGKVWAIHSNGKYRYRHEFRRTNHSENSPLWSTIVYSGSKDINPTFRIPPPDIESVLNSLVMDGSALFDGEPFEDWCMNFGYESDSRKAHKIYKKCLDIGHNLNKLLGTSLAQQLRECEQL